MNVPAHGRPDSPTIDRPLGDTDTGCGALYLIRHSAPNHHAHERRRAAAGDEDAFHVEYRVYAPGIYPSFDDVKAALHAEPLPRSSGLVIPVLVLLVAVGLYWRTHDAGGWTDAVSAAALVNVS